MIKLPRTLHIEGSRMPPGSVDPEAIEFAKLKGQFLVVEEKLDGTGVSLWFDEKLDLQIFHRGSPANGVEFELLHTWANLHLDDLYDLLGQRFVLFGEWMYLKHSIFYDELPIDGTQPIYFLESDIYDSKACHFLSTAIRHSMLQPYPFIHSVPVLKSFEPSSLNDLISLIGKSEFQSKSWIKRLQSRCEKSGQKFDKLLQETDQSGLMEGLYIKHEGERHVADRYKYVRYDFLQTILQSKSHYKDRYPFRNVYRL